jgi:hypothetical protein
MSKPAIRSVDSVNGRRPTRSVQNVASMIVRVPQATSTNSRTIGYPVPP